MVTPFALCMWIIQKLHIPITSKNSVNTIDSVKHIKIWNCAFNICVSIYSNKLLYYMDLNLFICVFDLAEAHEL